PSKLRVVGSSPAGITKRDNSVFERGCPFLMLLRALLFLAVHRTTSLISSVRTLFSSNMNFLGNIDLSSSEID
ncbi:MAG: hypothetical protein KQH67_12545, partial [Bacteroidetes bacterium]|nr:hypothetical protein [Bacteroidota bacterium]